MTEEQTEEQRKIATLTAALGEVVERLAQLEGQDETIDIIVPKVRATRGEVTTVRRADGRVVQRVTRPR
jgi:hypothetical protein